MTKDSEVEEIFTHNGHVCVVVKISQRFIGRYHNGYVRVAEDREEVDVERSNLTARSKKEGYIGMDVTYDRFLTDIDTAELTYSGTLSSYDDVPEGYYMGFDTVHAWNEEHPESKTFTNVRQRTMKLVEEMEEQNVFNRVKKNETDTKEQTN